MPQLPFCSQLAGQHRLPSCGRPKRAALSVPQTPWTQSASRAHGPSYNEHGQLELQPELDRAVWAGAAAAAAAVDAGLAAILRAVLAMRRHAHREPRHLHPEPAPARLAHQPAATVRVLPAATLAGIASAALGAELGVDVVGVELRAREAVAVRIVMTERLPVEIEARLALRLVVTRVAHDDAQAFNRPSLTSKANRSLSGTSALNEALPVSTPSVTVGCAADAASPSSHHALRHSMNGLNAGSAAVYSTAPATPSANAAGPSTASQ